MYKIDSPGSSAGNWVDKNPVSGTPGTQIVADWMNEAQYELVNIIEACGIVLAKGTRTQLRDAVKRWAGGFVKTCTNAGSPYTLTPGDAGLVIVDASGGAVTINVPAANAFGSLRFRFVRSDGSGNSVSIIRAGADTFAHGTGAPTALKLVERYKVREIVSDGVSKWHVFSEPAPRALHGREGLVIQKNTGSPNSQVDIDAAVLDVEHVRFAGVDLTADIATAGANGLDTGAEGNSTHYFIWAIANVTDPENPVIAGLLSTSRTAPTLPAGYTLKERIGWVYNNAAGNFQEVIQYKADGGWVYRRNDDVGNVGAGEDDLYQLTLPAGELGNNGAELRIWSRFDSNEEDNSRIKFYFGASSLTVKNTGASSALTSVRIARTGVSAQRMGASHIYASGSADIDVADWTENLANALTLRFTGENLTDSSSNAVVQKQLVVEYVP